MLRRTLILTSLLLPFIGWLLVTLGCARWVAHGLVDAPNKTQSETDLQSREPTAPVDVCNAFRLNVGPPDATLSIWTIDPQEPPRGTVLVLHGIRDQKVSQLGMGRTLAAAGYRAVLVDLRGHGLSSGQWLTYGVVESRDLSQLLDGLRDQGQLIGPVGVFGCSYGGSVGVQLAGVDPRIKAVVAVAPFADVHGLIRCYARQMNMSWLLTDRAIDEGFEQACALANCDLRQADPVEAASQSRAHLLLFHGRDDRNIPCEHSERIATAAGERARVVLIDGADHVSIMRDDDGVIAHETVAWFHQHVHQ